MTDRTVYGPVSSRRLGHSLGIDPIPLKTCNWNCIYCQLGRSRPLKAERHVYIPTEIILEEVRRALEHQEPDAIDWITFVGSGEPLLHAGIGDLIRGVRTITDLPLAVITNGSLLSEPEVREALLPVQAVLPSVDAGSEALFRHINRPHSSWTFARHIEGLVAFREAFSGRLLVEVMLLAGINDMPAALKDIAEVLMKIRPDEIHLVIPTRPAVEPWVRAAGPDGILRAVDLLSRAGHVKSEHLDEQYFSRLTHNHETEELAEIIQRHPMTDAQVRQTVERWAPARAAEILEALPCSKRVRTVIRDGQIYWVSASASFPDEESRADAKEKPRPSRRKKFR